MDGLAPETARGVDAAESPAIEKPLFRRAVGLRATLRRLEPPHPSLPLSAAWLVAEIYKSARGAGARKATFAPWRSAFAALRPEHWVKNALVFVPLVTSHRLFELRLATAAVIACASFCLCASAAYVLNDLVDLAADRQHPIKRRRPLASGALPIGWALPLAGALLVFGFTLSGLMLPARFSAALGVYFMITCAYSLLAKRVAMLDVSVLAGLYTIRVLAGAAATGIVVSEWLMAFSMFLFVSLALAKRYAELERLARTDQSSAQGRGYRVSDLGLIQSMGPASGYLAVLVLALYVNSDQMRLMYRNPWPLWLVCPVLLYWISRVWLKASRGELSEDPVVFALRDRVSFGLGIVTIALLAAGSLLPI